MVPTNVPFKYEPPTDDGGSVDISPSVLEQFKLKEGESKDILVSVTRYNDDTLFPSKEKVVNVSTRIKTHCVFFAKKFLKKKIIYFIINFNYKTLISSYFRSFQLPSEERAQSL